ncbi:MAG: hypothetical protein Ta2G_10610 [Termitinemataceae bacterium]|nr:MAG: hypothetical protein Ta2G_10610 [Termitinemataceae bacterium]
MNRRTKTVTLCAIILFCLLVIIIAGLLMNRSLYSPAYSNRLFSPSLRHIFGTDYLGRDMFFRTLKGLSTSIMIGTLAATISAIIALAGGLLSALRGGITDKIVSWFVDLFMSIPHLVLLMLVSYMLGKGERGVIIAIAITHWPSLTRLLRAEVLQVCKNSRSFRLYTASNCCGTHRSAYFTAIYHRSYFTVSPCYFARGGDHFYRLWACPRYTGNRHNSIGITCTHQSRRMVSCVFPRHRSCCNRNGTGQTRRVC